MIRMISMLMLLLVVVATCGQAQTAQAGIFETGATTFIVRAKLSGGNITNVPFTGVTVTVYWQTSSNITLGTPSSSYSIDKAGGVGTDGGYSYQKFSGTPNTNISIADGGVIDLFTVSVSGTGPAILELKNPPAAANGDWYCEIGSDRTNAGSPFYASSTELALPITLVSFTGNPNQGGVLLEWKTASEVNNYGYTVQRRQGMEEVFSDLSSAFIPGAGTTGEQLSYTFQDKSITIAGSYHYRLKQQDLDGTVHYSQSVIVNVTATDVAEVAPRSFRLSQNYPNPFNPTTQIRFSVATTEQAVLNVYNLLGEEVATLFDGIAEAGRYYVVTFDAAHVASGLYFYRLRTDSNSDVRKLFLLR